MKFLVCLVALIAVSSAAQIPQPKSALTEIIKNLFNNNIDKLANLLIELIPIGENGEFGSLHNLNFKELETIQMVKMTGSGFLSPNIDNGTFSLAHASATSDFEFFNVQVPEIGLNMNGVGTLSGTAYDLFLTGALDCLLHGLAFEVLDFKNLYMHMGKIDATLTGIDNQEANNEIINTKLAGFLNDNLVRIAYENKPFIIGKINEIISGMS